MFPLLAACSLPATSERLAHTLCPRRGEDAVRRYNEWPGNPKGDPEDPTRCVEEVASWGSWLHHQCRRKRGHGPGGLYCKQHGKKAEERLRQT